MIGRDTENKSEKSNVPHVSIKPNATHKGVRIKLLPYTNFYLEVYATK